MSMKIVRWMSSKNRVAPIYNGESFMKRKSNAFRKIHSALKSSWKSMFQKTSGAFVMCKDFKKNFQKATKEDFMYNGSFHEAARPVFLIAHVFSVMPVNGLKAPDARGLSFSWTSCITIYSLMMTFFLFVYFLFTLNFTFDHPLKLDDIDPIMFYGTIFCVHFKFGLLSKKWPQLMMRWREIELKLPELQSQWEKAALAHQIKMITLVVLMMSLIEHLLSMITVIHYANYCNPDKDPVTEVFKTQLSQMFYVTEYTLWKALLGKVLNTMATFIWNYMDLFVMIVSVGLAHKFRQVNASLFRSKGKLTSESYWSEHRKHYRNLCNLCDEIDNAISFITMVSFSNNIYFICVQLLRSLNEMPSFAHALYFWFALVFLIGRTLAVSLYSAEINDESKKPVVVFRCVPQESWCLEVKRFSEEVTSGSVALSGMRFFYLTRNLVLSVAGTIVTYELVLIQFHVQENNSGC